MKNSIADLLRAAQTAGAEQPGQDFWREVNAHIAAKTAKLVQPRPLTDPVRPGTIQKSTP